MNSRFATRLGAGLAAFAVAAIAAAPAGAQQLKGLFRISAGSYFRMEEPAGAKAKFFANPYSTDANKTYTLVTGGTDGGLRTGVLQSAPTPAFDAKGDSLAKGIIAPANFTGIKFGLVTVGTAPSITASGGRLSEIDGDPGGLRPSTFVHSCGEVVAGGRGGAHGERTAPTTSSTSASARQ